MYYCYWKSWNFRQNASKYFVITHILFGYFSKSAQKFFIALVICSVVKAYTEYICQLYILSSMDIQLKFHYHYQDEMKIQYYNLICVLSIHTESIQNVTA